MPLSANLRLASPTLRHGRILTSSRSQFRVQFTSFNGILQRAVKVSQTFSRYEHSVLTIKLDGSASQTQTGARNIGFDLEQGHARRLTLRFDNSKCAINAGYSFGATISDGIGLYFARIFPRILVVDDERLPTCFCHDCFFILLMRCVSVIIETVVKANQQN